MDHIGFFCSSRDIAISSFGEIILPLLSLLYSTGTRNIYYGGGDQGLMGKLYYYGTELGMNVIGHNLEKWSSPTLPNEILYTNLLDRQNGLVKVSQYYIILPGGIGTIYELTQVLCHNDVERVGKKIILYNYHHYYDAFIQLLKHMIEKGLTDMDRLELTVVRDIDELSVFIKNL